MVPSNISWRCWGSTQTEIYLVEYTSKDLSPSDDVNNEKTPAYSRDNGLREKSNMTLDKMNKTQAFFKLLSIDIFDNCIIS